MVGDGDAVGSQLLLHHRGKAVLNKSLGHLAACGNHPAGVYFPGSQREDRGISCPLLHPAQPFLFNDQRDNPGARQLIPTVYRGIGVASGDDDGIIVVDGLQSGYIHLEQAVTVGQQLDFPLLHRSGGHVLVAAQPAQTLRRFVFMEHSLLLLPHVEVLFAHGQQHRDVLRGDDVALAEPGILGDAGDDLGQVMAQHMAHCLTSFNEFHGAYLQSKKSAV